MRGGRGRSSFGTETAFGYDPGGNVTAITPPGRPAHTFAYNAVGLEAIYDPPDVGLVKDVTTFTYNLAQQLTQVLRPDDKAIDLGYDAGGRLSTLTLPRGPLSFSYDAGTGNLANLTAPDGGSLSFAYNADLLTASTWSGAISGTVSRAYDTERRVASRSVNGASPVAFGFDADGLLTQAGDLSLTRDPQHGLVTATSLGNVVTATGYNAFAERETDAADVSGVREYEVSYTRDALGRITEKTETVEGVTTVTDYTYDLAGRLQTVTTDGLLTAEYEYDANGNRVGGFDSDGPVSASYDAQDRLLDYRGNTYSYTANGELTSKTDAAGTTAYSYDVLGNLLSVTLPDGTLVEYVADGFNRRIGKRVNGLLQQGFLYKDQLNPIAELDGAGNVISRFVYGEKPNVPAYLVKGGVTYRMVSDHLGSARLVIDTATGEVVQRLDYDAFGNVLTDTNPGFQPFGFAGGLYDPDTGLVRFGARDYDPEIGRWTAKDPIRFNGGDTNFYGYVNNDPVNAIDPSGQLAPLAAIGLVAFVGGVAQGTAAALSGGSFLSGFASGALLGASITAGVLAGGATIGAGLIIEGGSVIGALGGAIGAIGFEAGINLISVGSIIGEAQGAELQGASETAGGQTAGFCPTQ